MDFLPAIAFLAILAGPAFLIDRSVTPQPSTKGFWWMLAAACGVGGLLLPELLHYLVPRAAEFPVSMETAAQFIGLALPWVVYLFFRRQLAGNTPTPFPPQATPSPAHVDASNGIAKGFRVARMLAIIAILLVLILVAIVIFVAACCSR